MLHKELQHSKSGLEIAFGYALYTFVFFPLSHVLLMLELKHCHACVWKIQHKGACREANTARGEAKCCICLEIPQSAVFFVHTSIGGALTVILYFLVVWLGAIFSSTQTTVTFGDQAISKCLTNLFPELG